MARKQSSMQVSTCSTKSEHNTARKTERLFGRFRAIYGGRWTACYSTPESIDLAIEEWDEVIERMNDEQLNDAIEWAKTCSPWPPSIAEFLHAGIGIDEIVIRDTAIALMRREGSVACSTYKEIATAARLGRNRAVQILIEQELQPACPRLGYDS